LPSPIINLDVGRGQHLRADLFQTCMVVADIEGPPVAGTTVTLLIASTLVPTPAIWAKPDTLGDCAANAATRNSINAVNGRNMFGSRQSKSESVVKSAYIGLDD